MTRGMIGSYKMTDIVEDYVRLAKEWGEAMNSCDSSTANAIHDRIQQLHQRIVETRMEGFLLDHLNDENDLVSFFVASHVKERDTSRALPVYERLSHSSLPFIALSAKWILKEISE